MSRVWTIISLQYIQYIHYIKLHNFHCQLPLEQPSNDEELFQDVVQQVRILVGDIPIRAYPLNWLVTIACTQLEHSIPRLVVS